MLGSHVLADLEADQLSEHIDIATPWGKQEVQTRIQSPSSSIRALKQAQLPLLALKHRDAVAALPLVRSEIKNCIAPHSEIIDECCKDVDSRIQESVGQILWSPKSLVAPLNKVPVVVSGLVTWKTIVLPAIAVIMPLLAIIAPFFVLRFVQGEKVGATEYMSHVRKILLSQVSIPPSLRAKHGGDVVGYVIETGFLLITCFTFVSGIWNQIVTALHQRRIAADLEARSAAIHESVASVRRVLDILNGLPSRLKVALCKLMNEGDAVLKLFEGMPAGLAGFGFVWNDSQPLHKLREWIGRVDMYTSIASLKSICFPQFSRGTSLQLRGVYHPRINPANRVFNNANFGEKHHVVLTGPNRGGKSTFCKAVGLAVLCAQTLGFAWAAEMRLEPFIAMETALSPTDELGKLSLFEAEIEFAKTVLERSASPGPVLVMMDEIFHSTNASDGLAASRVFLEKLYIHGNVTSIVSTHYRELVKSFSKEANAWAMEAHEKEDGLLNYSYRVVSGVSDKSSVMEILRERGL